MTESGGYSYEYVYVNGIYVRFGYVSIYDGGRYSMDSIYRPDLTDPNDTDKYVKYYQVERSLLNGRQSVTVGNVEVKDYHSYFEGALGFKKSFPEIEFEKVEQSTFDGKQCNKYVDSTGKYILYTDSDDLPIGGEIDGTKIVIQYTKEAPLSLFKYNTSDVFGDDRIYRAPKYSLCTDDFDGSSTQMVSFLVLLLSIVAALLF